MQTGLHLYQAIIDRSLEKGIEYEEASAACGVDGAILSSCFDATEGVSPHNLYDLLSRDAIDATSRFLGCSGFRVFLLADVFKWQDYRLLTVSDVVAESAEGIRKQTSEAAHYIRSVVQANIFGAPEFIVEEFVAATLSNTLDEACTKTNLCFETLLSWKNRTSTAALRDLECIKVMAESMDMGTPVVMGSLGLLRKEDFVLNGQLVDLDKELKAALEIEVW